MEAVGLTNLKISGQWARRIKSRVLFAKLILFRAIPSELKEMSMTAISLLKGKLKLNLSSENFKKTF